VPQIRGQGITEALINDLRLNAPHIKCSVVMPGISDLDHVQFAKSAVCTDSDRMSEIEIAQTRVRLTVAGVDASKMSDEDVQAAVAERARSFREDAPMTPLKPPKSFSMASRPSAGAFWSATTPPAHELVRQTPERAYEPITELAKEVGWRIG